MKSLPIEHASTTAPQVLAATAHTLPEQVDALDPGSVRQHVVKRGPSSR